MPDNPEIIDTPETAEDQESSTHNLERPDLSLIEVLGTLWKGRMFVAGFVGILSAAALVISLILPKYYKATTIVLPETDQSKLAGLAGLSGLASLAGVKVGETRLEDLYPAIIQSESILSQVIYHKYKTEEYPQPVDLIEYWEIEEETPLKSFEVALEELRDELSISVDRRTNVVTVSLHMKEPVLASDIVNKITEELDGFIRTKRKTNASEQREWIEARLEEVKRDLSRSEDSLRTFREKNRRIADSPHLLLEHERLSREVLINSTLYTELKKQYELAKIEEIKNIPVINVLDAARPASEKSKPRRMVILIVTFLVSLASSTGFLLLKSRFHSEYLQLKNSVLGKTNGKRERTDA